MDYKTFVRKPFTIEAVQITNDNLDEVAEMIGTVVEEDGVRYIQVDKKDGKGRPVVPNVTRVSPGFWLTRIGKNIRCYKSSVFKNQFTESTPNIQEWVDSLNGRGKKEAVNE